MADFKTIGEVSLELGVEPHTIRFWEKEFEELHPVKRRGNRRFYSEEDVAILHEIRNLLHNKGYTIKGARQAMTQNKNTPTENKQADFFSDQNKEPKTSEALNKLLSDLKEIQNMLEKV